MVNDTLPCLTPFNVNPQWQTVGNAVDSDKDCIGNGIMANLYIRGV